MTLYRKQGSRPFPWKRNAKKKKKYWSQGISKYHVNVISQLGRIAQSKIVTMSQFITLYTVDESTKKSGFLVSSQINLQFKIKFNRDYNLNFFTWNIYEISMSSISMEAKHFTNSKV